jgi:uncharacterized surface protein with fasciclin (FAS1) repeats
MGGGGGLAISRANVPSRTRRKATRLHERFLTTIFLHPPLTFLRNALRELKPNRRFLMQRTIVKSIAAAVVVAVSGSAAMAQCHGGWSNVSQETRQDKVGNLAKVAKSAGQFKTLLAAAEAAGFTSDLADGGPYTILAPTDAAFAKLGDGKIAELLKPENRDTLRAILRYHVIKGEVNALDAIKAGKAATRNGAEVAFAIRDGKLLANSSTITATDIKASNGVIHVIDTVLLPPAAGAADGI